MRRRVRPVPAVLISFLASLVVASCTPGGPAATTSRRGNVIRAAELETSTAMNAWDVVDQLRPNWLRGRGSPDLRGSPPDLPLVYIGTTRYGNVESLRAIPTPGILELRYLSAAAATTRYGNGHSGGVIEVVLRRR